MPRASPASSWRSPSAWATDALERVHVEQRHAVEARDGRVDVARHAEVDHPQRPGDAGEGLELEHVGLCRHRRQHHVRVRQLRGDVVERRRAHLERRLGHRAHQFVRALGRPVDDDHPLRCVGGGQIGQRTEDAPAHVARSDHHDARAAQPRTVRATRDRHRGVGERRRPLADPRLGAHTLAGLEGVAEERGEDRAARALLLGPFEGAPDLAGDLGLPRDDGLEARRHREEVGGDVVVEAEDGVKGELFDRDLRLLGQDVVDLGDGVVEPVHHRVDLGAQAGREHDRLLHVALVAQRAERLVQVRLRDRRGLEQRQGRLRVLQPYDDDGHWEILLGRGSILPVPPPGVPVSAPRVVRPGPGAATSPRRG